MSVPAVLTALLVLTPTDGASPIPADTIHLDVGAAQADGRIFPAHLARNRVYLAPDAPPVTTWTNELLVGDSAGRPVQRWITRGVGLQAEGKGGTWELHQTYDARTLQPLTYFRTGSDGASLRLRVDGTRVHGVALSPGGAPEPVEWTLDRPAYFAGASDLVPMAMELAEGMIVTAPVWSPGMDATEVRVFEVHGMESVLVEGARVDARKVVERVRATGALVATWYITDRSPYMVIGETPLANGGVRRVTGVDLDRGR
ncbi:MAG: hypothetical protein KC645_15970 [Gemmatimonadetes bacterium]|nr:hypothetical protein [Gemmatimonadota bacterium]